MKAPCPRCKSKSGIYLRAKDRNRRISEEIFPYYRCSHCNLVFLSPIPEDLADYYPPEYYFAPPSYGAHPTLEQVRTFAEAERYKIELVQRFVATGRLLEIGPSWGTFSYLSKEAGFETEAIEMDADCCRFLTEVIKIKAINDINIPRALQHVEPYDVVAFWHSLEHIPDPWGTLRAVAKVLVPGGILIVSTPNPGSLQFRIFGRFWFHLDAPRHLELIPAALLQTEMSNFGFETVLKTSTDKGSVSLNSPGWEASLINLFSRQSWKVQAQKAGQHISRFVRGLEERDGLGSAYTLVLGKLAENLRYASQPDILANPDPAFPGMLQKVKIYVKVGKAMFPFAFLRVIWRHKLALLRSLPTTIVRWSSIVRSTGFRGLEAHLRKIWILSSNPKDADVYRLWVKDHTPTTADLWKMKLEAERLSYKPLFSIVMPVFDVEEQWLRKALDSVLAQVYPHWEACLADDASTQPHVKRVLREYQGRDQRIKITYRPENGHICAATNSALSLVTGDFICLMDHDDEIAPDALFEFARLLNERPDTDMIYSDEDKIDTGGNRYDPFFKPDWSPEYLETCMCTSHFACYRTEVVNRVGRFRVGYEGSQDYDFVLRFVEQTEKILHIPKVFYHWRAHPQSTASSTIVKDYASESALKALQDRLQRTDATGRVTARQYVPSYRIDRNVKGNPLVSIIIPSAGPMAKIHGNVRDVLVNCISSIYEKSTYRNFEIIVVASRQLKSTTTDLISPTNSRVIPLNGPFNFSGAINLGASHARGEYLLILNDDTEVIAPGWIEAMLQLAQSPGTGAVGAKLYYDDNTIQHVGVTLNGDGLPDHLCLGFPGESPGHCLSFVGNRNCLAVTGACLMSSTAVFFNIGRFNEDFPLHYNDVDYCLKLHKAGYRIVYAADAELFHYEGQSKVSTVKPDEMQLFLKLWKHEYSVDPYYNVNFDRNPPRYAIKL